MAEALTEYSTLHCLWQHLHHVWWHEESLWSKCHQDCTPQVHHWQHYHRLRQTDGGVGRTLPGTLLKGEHCHWLNCQEYLQFVYLGKAWHPTLSRGSEQGHHTPLLAAKLQERWHPTRSHQGWQADCPPPPPPPPPQASATVLGRGDCAPRHVWCKHHHPIQEQGWPQWLQQITMESPSSALVGKAFASMVLNRLQVLAEHIYSEAQCGLRAGRLTIDMIFSLHQLQEKCHKQRWPLYIAFINLTKAFDLVSWKGLFTLLQRIGCPPKLLRIITSFHEGMQGTVQYDCSSSYPFPIRNVVKQGLHTFPNTLQHLLLSSCCCLTPSVSQKMVHTSLPEVMEASSASHTSEQRPRCEEYWLGSCWLQMMLPWLHTLRKLYSDSSAASHAHVEFSLTISVKKTNIMGQDLSSIPSISIGDYILEVVEDFSYLGSTISGKISLDAKLNTWIGKAATAMAHLAKRVW